jgi:hypothetical protein
MIGGIDLLFAPDSIPAVFGVTQEVYIVFAANAFALLGLRALFFLVKGLLDRRRFLDTELRDTTRGKQGPPNRATGRLESSRAQDGPHLP